MILVCPDFNLYATLLNDNFPQYIYIYIDIYIYIYIYIYTLFNHYYIHIHSLIMISGLNIQTLINRDCVSIYFILRSAYPCTH